ncbi:MAG: alpha-galactosidase [Ruminococcaceae bacterium]|nr:alpha-galactosidase [Oscillospiraceae bacterium]
MLNFKFTENGFSFENNLFNSGLLTPYVKFYLTKDASEEISVINGPYTANGSFTTDTFLGKGTCYIFEHTENTHKLTLNYTSVNNSANPTLIIEAIYTNKSDSDVYLNQFGFKHIGNQKFTCYGDADNWYLGYTASLAERLKSFNQIRKEMYEYINMPLPDLSQDEQHTDGRWRIFSEYLPLYPKDDKNGLFLSPIGEATAFVSNECFVDTTENNEGTIKLNSYCDMSNTIVKPGKSRISQKMVIAYGPYDEIAETVYNDLKRTHGSRTEKGAIVGWCSWYDLYSQITEESVTKTVEAINRYKDIIPMDVIQIDDGFQKTVGDWEVNEKFPHGWEPIIAKIKESGATPGIWLAPALIHNSTETFKNHPDWLMRNENNELIGAHGNWGEPSYPLDFSNPEAYDFAINLIKTEYNRGFRYFKFDFNAIYANGRSAFAGDKTSLELYRHVYKGYREIIGEESYLCACSGFCRGTFGFADSSRIGPDSPPDWKTPDVSCISGCIKHVGYYAHANGYFFANDPDVTYLYAKRLTENELLTWHSMVGLHGGSQMISDPLWKKENSDNLRRFEILSPPASEKAVPLHPAVDGDNKRFGFIARRDYGDFAAAMIYNPYADEKIINTEFNKFKKIGEKFHVWSFWDNEYLGVKNYNFAVSLPSHGCKVLRLTSVNEENGICIIGSDLHISMGAAEINDFKVNGSSLEIILNANAGARSGAIYLYCEAEVNSIDYKGINSASFEKNGNILKLNLNGRSRTGEQSIKINLL